MNNLINPTAAQFAFFTGLTIEESAVLMNDAKKFTIAFEAPEGDFRCTAINGYLALVAVDYMEEMTEYMV
jgi:hypothetical protein